MKKPSIITLCLLLCSMVKAQVLQPVHWSYAIKKISSTDAVFFLKATIDDGWHVYSQHVKEGGPIKTTITFKASPDYALTGVTTEPKPITRREETFKMDVSYFENSVIFQQKIKLKKGQTTVNGSLEYMTCNDRQCLSPENLDFSVSVK